MTWDNAEKKFRAGTDPGTRPVADSVMGLWRDGTMTTPQSHPHIGGVAEPVQLGLFAPAEPDPARFVHPRHRTFAALLARASVDEGASLEILAQLEPDLAVLVRRLVRRGVEPEVARGEARSVAWEVVAGHRVGPVLPTKACLVSAVWTELRREVGLRRQRHIELVPLSDEVDVAAPESAPAERRPWLLVAAVAAGVLSERQAALIALTRIDGQGLVELAAELGRPYHALRKERRRAEMALAAFARPFYAEDPR